MKIKKLFLMLAAVSFLTVSCEMMDNMLTQFDMPYESSFTIPKTTLVDLPIDITTPPITTNSESTFEIKKTARNLIEEITLKELKLVISLPDDANFDFLKKLELFIKADGLKEMPIASLSDIPKGTRELVFQVEDTNLKDYIFSDSFSLRTKMTTVEIISKDIDVDVKTVFHVDAKILGI